VQEDLRALGHPVVTAAVGPFSSNWDRAAELFAILKGGPVDYGLAHARRHGHARFGRTFPGLLPAWGTPAQPLAHLVGHSMGGQTIRVLATLLAEGSAEEREATPGAELSPLFQGGHPWMLSLTSISTPHDGTTLARRHEGLSGVARRMLAFLGGLPTRKPVYDLKLDPWGLTRHPGESWSAYRDRILASPLWQGTRDFSAWDLGLEGARELNGWVRLPREAYGFTWSTAQTREGPGKVQVPEPGMNLVWHPGARYLGRPHPAAEGQLPVDETWHRNDGVVNTRSMAGPAGEEILPFAGEAVRGAWNAMGILEGWDHSAIIGMGPEHGGEVLDFYRRWAAFLVTLEG
jgi:triacylglycerol lipase